MVFILSLEQELRSEFTGVLFSLSACRGALRVYYCMYGDTILFIASKMSLGTEKRRSDGRIDRNVVGVSAGMSHMSVQHSSKTPPRPGRVTRRISWMITRGRRSTDKEDLQPTPNSKFDSVELLFDSRARILHTANGTQLQSLSRTPVDAVERTNRTKPTRSSFSKMSVYAVPNFVSRV